jgi:indole-3-glycerol phosphate synthase
MNILDTIIAYKKEEVKKDKSLTSVAELESMPFYSALTYSLKKSLSNPSGTGIIAEFKRKSPSKGVFNKDARVEVITKTYADQGAAGLSILTDNEFFGGHEEDLEKARINKIPILRKDFIIDEYQLTESKAIGADVILLIAACLSIQRVKELAVAAKRLNLEVLLEIHNEAELNHICDEVDIVGVNNRDLKDFTVDINRSIELSNKIPPGKIKISESGISDTSTIALLKKHGYRGFLIGETFMKEPDPAIAFASFIQKLKTG